MLVDDERSLYGKTWKDNDVEELSKSVAERFPVFTTKQNPTSENGSIENSTDAVMSVGSAASTGGSGAASSIASGSGGSKSSMEVSSMKGKRRASPTELPKEDKRGDTRMSKRPSIKRSLRSSDGSSSEGLAATTNKSAWNYFFVENKWHNATYWVANAQNTRFWIRFASACVRLGSSFTITSG